MTEENKITTPSLEQIKTEQNPRNLRTYNQNENILAHGQQQSFTVWEVEEYRRCKEDINYFASNYVKILNVDDGEVLYEPYDYQRSLYNMCDNNRFNIVLAPRQSGKSLCFVVYILHFILFNEGKSALIMANKLETAVEMLERLQNALEGIPFFLQPGCKTLNKKSIVLSNKSKVTARSTKSSSARGMSINLLYLDEFAFVEHSEKFYTGTYPVITSGKSTKVIITSTMNGVGNQFYKLWNGAKNKTNNFAYYEVNWWDVPGRDEKWKEETIANTSKKQFAQEFENKALGSANTLLSEEALLSLIAKNPIFTSDSESVLVYEKPNIKHRYILTADVAEGISQDYSTFSITDVSKIPFQQVATFRSNTLSPYLFSEIIVKFGKIYNDALLCVENNDRGSLVNHIIINDLEYENIYQEKFGNLGLKTTRKTKRIGCSNLRDLIEQNKYKINDKSTIEELYSFVEKSGSYAASFDNHDDMVMSLVLFAYISSTVWFANEYDVNLKKTLFDADAVRHLHEEEIPHYGGVILKSGDDVVDHGRILYEFQENGQNKRFVTDELFGIVIETDEDNNYETDAINFKY